MRSSNYTPCQRALFGASALLLLLVAQFSFAEGEMVSKQMSRAESSSRSTVQNVPKIAVTDLSFEEKVRKNFVKYDMHESSSMSHSSSGAGGAASWSHNNNGSAQAERSEHFESGTDETIDRGELRKFTADIKGEMLKSGLYRLTQGKPWVKKDTDNLYDIIARIKDGYYPNADFVLFGSVSAADFRADSNPIQGSNAVNYSLSIDLTAEFSLINTRTYEVVASFSASGEGTDSKLTNAAGTGVSLSKSKAVRDLSKSLGEDVAKQLMEQFSPGNTRSSESRSESVQEKRVTFH